MFGLGIQEVVVSLFGFILFSDPRNFVIDFQGSSSLVF